MYGDTTYSKKPSYGSCFVAAYYGHVNFDFNICTPPPPPPPPPHTHTQRDNNFKCNFVDEHWLGVIMLLECNLCVVTDQYCFQWWLDTEETTQSITRINQHLVQRHIYAALQGDELRKQIAMIRLDGTQKLFSEWLLRETTVKAKCAEVATRINMARSANDHQFT